MTTRRKNIFDPPQEEIFMTHAFLSQLENIMAMGGSKAFFRSVDNGSNVFFRRVVIFSERNLSGSKAFSRASASRDYMSLPTLTGSKVIPPCTRFKRTDGQSSFWNTTVERLCNDEI